MANTVMHRTYWCRAMFNRPVHFLCMYSIHFQMACDCVGFASAKSCDSIILFAFRFFANSVDGNRLNVLHWNFVCSFSELSLFLVYFGIAGENWFFFRKGHFIAERMFSIQKEYSFPEGKSKISLKKYDFWSRFSWREMNS